MIRSLNIVLGVVTVIAGAWMFTVKHNTEALEHKIAAVNQKIQHAQQKLVVLRATWAQENDPNRLAKLSKQFLPHLKPMAPHQLVSWQQLAAMLPPPGSTIPGGTMPSGTGRGASLVAETTMSPVISNAPARTATTDLAAAIAPPPHTRSALIPESRSALRPHSRNASQPESRSAPKLRRVVHVLSAPPRHIIIRAAQQRPIAVQRLPAETPGPYSHHAVHPMGAQVMSITAESAHTRGGRSVFGGYGADLPPPQPLPSASRGTTP